MGFPYIEVFSPASPPRHVLSLLKLLLSGLFRAMGFRDFLGPNLIRELLPLGRFIDLEDPTAESCSVCLSEFEGEDQIRRLTNCHHIFHRDCVDRWMDQDRRTCPLCRAPLVPFYLKGRFNRWVLIGSGIFPDSNSHSSITEF